MEARLMRGFGYADFPKAGPWGKGRLDAGFLCAIISWVFPMGDSTA